MPQCLFIFLSVCIGGSNDDLDGLVDSPSGSLVESSVGSPVSILKAILLDALVDSPGIESVGQSSGITSGLFCRL